MAKMGSLVKTDKNYLPYLHLITCEKMTLQSACELLSVNLYFAKHPNRTHLTQLSETLQHQPVGNEYAYHLRVNFYQTTITGLAVRCVQLRLTFTQLEE
jgi:hypothetical protein